jgi:DNA-binding transcriptional ArsR family regulator
MSVRPQAPESKRPTDQSETDDPSTAELLDLFGDEYTRQVFEAVAEEPRCGRAVAEVADVSRPTAYRRLNDLCDAGLVRTEIEVCEDGHHRERFEAVAGSLSVSLDSDGIEAVVRPAE